MRIVSFTLYVSPNERSKTARLSGSAKASVMALAASMLGSASLYDTSSCLGCSLRTRKARFNLREVPLASSEIESDVSAPSGADEF